MAGPGLAASVSVSGSPVVLVADRGSNWPPIDSAGSALLSVDPLAAESTGCGAAGAVSWSLLSWSLLSSPLSTEPDPRSGRGPVFG